MSTTYDPHDILKLVARANRDEANFGEQQNSLAASANNSDSEHKQDPGISNNSEDLISLTLSHLGDPLDAVYSDYWEGYFKNIKK